MLPSAFGLIGLGVFEFVVLIPPLVRSGLFEMVVFLLVLVLVGSSAPGSFRHSFSHRTAPF